MGTGRRLSRQNLLPPLLPRATGYRADLIQIDVEGAESAVLHGAEATVRNPGRNSAGNPWLPMARQRIRSVGVLLNLGHQGNVCRGEGEIGFTFSSDAKPRRRPLADPRP